MVGVVTHHARPSVCVYQSLSLSAVPSPPTVIIDPFNRLETAGQSLTLTCSASVQEGIRGTPVLTWTREDASLLSDFISAPPLLSFPSLRTSHAGRYTCTARLSIPEAGVDVSGNSRTNVSIQCIHFYCHCTYVEVLTSFYFTSCSYPSTSHHIWISTEQQFLPRPEPHLHL